MERSPDRWALACSGGGIGCCVAIWFSSSSPSPASSSRPSGCLPFRSFACPPPSPHPRRRQAIGARFWPPSPYTLVVGNRARLRPFLLHRHHPRVQPPQIGARFWPPTPHILSLGIRARFGIDPAASRFPETGARSRRVTVASSSRRSGLGSAAFPLPSP